MKTLPLSRFSLVDDLRREANGNGGAVAPIALRLVRKEELEPSGQRTNRAAGIRGPVENLQGSAFALRLERLIFQEECESAWIYFRVSHPPPRSPPARASNTANRALAVLGPLALLAPPFTLMRVSIRGEATQIAGGPKEVWLARFPEQAINFELADFSFWKIVPRDARFVAGFGHIHNLSAAELAATSAEA